ncbi:MAG: DUF938 domain-containing protein [Proteobacteria bacterium]|nr:DUF938 domain-containing protein [Pseudomonadota bacterium]
MPADKPYAPACDRNQAPILNILRIRFAGCRQVLEIGSGTGQHAIHFAAALPQLTWQTSDRRENLAGIRQWLAEACLPNTPPPLELDVGGVWPTARFDAIFTANTLHIMSWDSVVALFQALPQVLAPNARLTVYGPFNYGGRFTSPSNAEFDVSLKATHPERGIRDFEAVDALAREIGFELVADDAMPANNRCLSWQQR